ncbi:MAG: beta-ketoacyl-[acyl-carrier-protein] synthase family protein [Candidatus Omnitrophota bacterium]
MAHLEGLSGPGIQNPPFTSRTSAKIIDATIVTPLGDNLEKTWQEMLKGNHAISRVKRFPVNPYGSKTACTFEDLRPTGGRSMIYTILDRLFAEMAPVPCDAFLITATAKAGLDNLELLCRGKPADIRDILPSSVTDMVSERLAMTAGGINISASCASSTIAVARGAALIAGGRTEAVLVCCADLVTEFIFSGFSSLKALAPGPCRPFDRDRQGLTLGDGAAAILLMSQGRAKRENRRPLGTVHGWGVANDATHITAPAKSGEGLVQAISRALKTSEIGAEQITAINAHGTGTVYNDYMELIAFQKVFGDRQVPIYSVKGAIGHSMGAAGGIEVALGLKTLCDRMAPPTVGLINPMDEARGRVSPEPVSLAGDYLLTTNSGFGGVNAALILGR